MELHGRAAQGERRLGFRSSLSDQTLAEAIARLSDWFGGRLAATRCPCRRWPVSPVYSTWYTFTAQDLDQERVAAETALAVRIGCGSVFVDDGWQRLAVGRGYAGCGDWVPEHRQPDLAGFSADVHDQGAGVVLWIAPLLLGRDAEAFDTVGRFAPHAASPLPTSSTPRHRSGPRAPGGDLHPAGRRLRPGGSQDRLPGHGHRLPGHAVEWRHRRRRRGDGGGLALIREQLEQAGHSDAAVEFRQPYVSPAIGAYGQILRASDCPPPTLWPTGADRRPAAGGRPGRARRHADGSSRRAGGGGPAALRLLVLGSAVSMELATLADEQSEALAGLLALWQEHAPVVLDGTLDVRGSSVRTTSFVPTGSTWPDGDLSLRARGRRPPIAG